MINDAIKTILSKYPQVEPHLKGNSAWVAGVFAYKVGEAPDDDRRLKDERRVARIMTAFFDEQRKRILEAARE